MRFLSIKAENVLGLEGTLEFFGNPILIYGNNLAGKSNLINLIRYCFTSGKTGKKYTEEKRLDRNELLPPGLKSGRAIFYFEHKNKRYLLIFEFGRRGSKVSEKIYLYDVDEHFSLADIEGSLKGKSPLADKLTDLRGKLIEIGIYPDVIDVLIAPSNVRNFEDAINEDIVTVPDVLKKEISEIHSASEKLLGNLEKLEAHLASVKDSSNKKFDELKKGYQEVSKEDKVTVDELFTVGKTKDALSKKQNSISVELTNLPLLQQKLQDLVKSLPQYRQKLLLLQKAKSIIQEQQHAIKLIEDKENLQSLYNKVKSAQQALNYLPSIENISLLFEFDLSPLKQIDTNALAGQSNIKSVLNHLENAKEKIRKAIKLANKYKVQLRLGELRVLRASYKRLEKEIKSPEPKPEGQEAIVVYSKEEKKSTVYLPLSSLIDNPEYLRGVDSTPMTYSERQLSEQERINILQSVKKKVQELENCSQLLNSAIDYIKEVKNNLIPKLSDEIDGLEKKLDGLTKELNDLVNRWTSLTVELNSLFNAGIEIPSLQTKDDVEKFVRRLEPKLQIIKDTFLDEMSQRLNEAGIRLKPLEQLTPESLDQEITKRTEDVSSRIKLLQIIRDWIQSNIASIEQVENYLLTCRILGDSMKVAKEMCASVYTLSDLNTVVERIASDIEETVRSCMEMVMPEEIVSFTHIGKGLFEVKLSDGSKITHPAGSHKAIISIGIMLTLAKLFDVPLVLDEATDRFDPSKLSNMLNYINSLCQDPMSPQICLVSYRTFNIEKNEMAADVVKDWCIYLVERKEGVLKRIQLSRLSEIIAQ